MRILVTGGAGFIGSHLVEALIAEGNQVAVIDNLSSGNVAYLPGAVELLEGTVLDADVVHSHFMRFRPEMVAHMAAQKSVSYSVQNPIYDAQENIVGSLNILESARRTECKRMVFASTGGALYGETDQLPTSEGHPTYPESPYGVAKLAVEHYLHCYSQIHGLPTAILRMANVYGPRQDPRGEAGVVAIFCNRALESRGVTIFGDGEQTRDYVFVEDVAEAFMRAMHHASPLNVNIATAVETSVNELVRAIEGIAGHPVPVTYEPGRPGEIRRSCLSWDKAKAVLGWSPTTDLATGLQKTYRYFRSVNAGAA